MKNKKTFFATFAILLLGLVSLNAYRPVRNLTTKPAAWTGLCAVKSTLPEYDRTKKTVFLIADYQLTEIFDLLAPFYLFNATGKANVYIVAKEKTPVLIKKELFLVPHLTFAEADSMHLSADVIVIPALSIRDEHQDPDLITWIKKYTVTNTKMLTICDGASTGAATGFYDGKIITCHASDIDGIKKHFSKPVWVQDISVARSGNFYSTAGVSNAVEGSLVVIDEIFGTETAHQVARDINYPHAEIRLAHQSTALNAADKLAVAKKILFRRNRQIGVLLNSGINEFALASLIDTYGRTFPASFRTLVLNDTAITTKYGLTLIYTGNNSFKGLGELHVLAPGSLEHYNQEYFKDMDMIRYDKPGHQYLFDIYLNRIGKLYGHQYEKFVKISLDYN